jgi:hypothetical protein
MDGGSLMCSWILPPTKMKQVAGYLQANFMAFVMLLSFVVHSSNVIQNTNSDYTKHCMR